MIKWPNQRSFAFSIFDDTDFSTIERVKPVYDLLRDLGFRTTKSIWPIKAEVDNYVGGSGTTCEDEEYLAWIRELQYEGFEIGSHLASYNTSQRHHTIASLERFKEITGHYPRCLANHEANQEGIYWGSDRFSGLNRILYNLLTKFKNVGYFQGHIPQSPFFWGDHCQKKIDYVRNFVFNELNTLKSCPQMPYRDIDRPFVKEWFASSNGSDVKKFIALLSKEKINQLEADGGASVVYTHFSYGFCKNGALDKRFVEILSYLSRKNGWFVPVSTLLDYIKKQEGPKTLSRAELHRLERRWLLQRIKTLGRL